MKRGLVAGLSALLFALVAGATHACTSDLVVVHLRARSVIRQGELSAGLRVFLRRDRKVSKVIVEQSSGYRAIDKALIKQFNEWQFLKAKNCDVVFVPVRIIAKPEKA